MPNAGKHNDPPECLTAGRPKVGIWCMIFVIIFRKLSLYWYMKMFVGYAIRYVISLRKKSSESTIVQQKSLSIVKTFARCE